MRTSWELKGERSALYPVLQKQLKDETEVLIQNQVTPWVFMKNHPGPRVKTFDEKEINYGASSFQARRR